MNDMQKEQIRIFRAKGYGYRMIAKNMGISKETVKSYCKRHGLGGYAKEKAPSGGYGRTDQTTCLNCGTMIEQIPKRKPKKFCCDKCRSRWWSKHPDQVNRKANYDFTCACCGKPFTAYGNSNRKYCSFDCYIKDRFGE